MIVKQQCDKAKAKYGEKMDWRLTYLLSNIFYILGRLNLSVSKIDADDSLRDR